jgi:protein-disulfide isomerase
MKKRDELQKLKFLTWAVVFAIVLTLINSYSLVNINAKVDLSNILKNHGGDPSAAQNQKNQIVAEPARKIISMDDDPVKGDANAPVTIIEFSDFECPFCARFYSQTLKQLEKEYIDTGKVKLVFRDFPLSFHQNAQKAAEAAECSEDQGKFWEMHDIIFENQQSLSISSLKQWAVQIGLDTVQFNSCLDSGKYYREVQNDFKDGASYGVSGTPNFFINGISLVGAHPFDAFKEIIDSELAK